MKTDVIFRYWENTVIAIFPDELGNMNPATCSSYQAIGQHGACAPDFIIQNSKLATPEQYQPLFDELTSIGYSLKIKKRYSHRTFGERRFKLKQIK